MRERKAREKNESESSVWSVIEAILKVAFSEMPARQLLGK